MNLFKKIASFSIVISIMFVASGCASKSGAGVYAIPGTKTSKIQERCNKLEKTTLNECNYELEVVSISSPSNLSNYGFSHQKYNNATAGVLQTAAITTEHYKMKYFAIVKPSSLSNTSGELINEAKDYFGKCDIGAEAMFVNPDPCGFHTKGGFMAHLTIAMFDEPQLEFVTYSTKEVLSYLKQNGLYDSDLASNIKNYRVFDLPDAMFDKFLSVTRR